MKRFIYNGEFREEDHPRGKDGKFGVGGGGEKKTESKKEAGGNREELLKKAIEKDPKLQRWGLNKEAIDENGNYIIYHGTNDENYKKIMSEGLKAPDSPRYFTTTTKKETAKEFAKGYSGDKIIKFAIPLDDVTDVLWKGGETSAYNDTQHALKKGYLDKKYIKQNTAPRRFIYNSQGEFNFDEAKHKRDSDGKFTSGGGGGTKGKKKEKKKDGFSLLTTGAERLKSTRQADKDMDEYIAKHHGLLKSTPYPQLSSVAAYCGHGFDEINGALLGKEQADEYTKKHIENISQYIRDNRIDRPMTLYRGMTLPSIEDLGEEGDNFVMKNFGSFSLDQADAQHFAGIGIVEKNPVARILIKTEFPEGSKIAPAIAMSDEEFVFNSDEHEFIADKETEYKIKKIEKHGENGKAIEYTVTLEVQQSPMVRKRFTEVETGRIITSWRLKPEVSKKENAMKGNRFVSTIDEIVRIPKGSQEAKPTAEPKDKKTKEPPKKNARRFVYKSRP